MILRRVFRFDGGPWRNVSTYIYMLDDEGNTIFNGANRSIEQTNVLRDHGPEVAQIGRDIIDTAKTRTEDGKSFVGGFVNYNWDDPGVEGDEPVGGRAGGGSPKLAYVKAFSLDKDESVDNPRIYIFGTGLYLGSQGDDRGCSIAGRADRIQVSMFNLFLVVFGLFLAISFKRCIARR